VNASSNGKPGAIVENLENQHAFPFRLETQGVGVLFQFSFLQSDPYPISRSIRTPFQFRNEKLQMSRHAETEIKPEIGIDGRGQDRQQMISLSAFQP
jgi:hypothetical protein